MAKQSRCKPEEIEANLMPRSLPKCTPKGDAVTLLIFHAYYCHAYYSLGHNWPDWLRKPLLLWVSVIASIFFLIWYFRLKEEDGLLLTAFCLILSGALGNLIDRFRDGFVVDFLDVYAGFLGYPNAHWPTFNIADSCIVVGAIFVFFKAFKSEKATASVF